jgi:hypothetical protein
VGFNHGHLREQLSAERAHPILGSAGIIGLIPRHIEGLIEVHVVALEKGTGQDGLFVALLVDVEQAPRLFVAIQLEGSVAAITSQVALGVRLGSGAIFDQNALEDGEIRRHWAKDSVLVRRQSGMAAVDFAHV